jgi:hypothetical protein
MPDDRDESEQQEQKRRLRIVPAPREGEVISRKPAPRRRDEDEIDDDGPSRSDIERFNNVTTRCPECRKEVYDDVEICYHCGHAMSRAPKGAPLWLIITVVAVLLAMIIAFIPWRAIGP